MNALYYGDNLQVLRDATESVDLIYLDCHLQRRLIGESGRDRMRGWSAMLGNTTQSFPGLVATLHEA